MQLKKRHRIAWESVSHGLSLLPCMLAILCILCYLRVASLSLVSHSINLLQMLGRLLGKCDPWGLQQTLSLAIHGIANKEMILSLFFPPLKNPAENFSLKYRPYILLVSLPVFLFLASLLRLRNSGHGRLRRMDG
jgi:hypothetical protein